jgi:hypothetical protein
MGIIAQLRENTQLGAVGIQPLAVSMIIETFWIMGSEGKAPATG